MKLVENLFHARNLMIIFGTLLCMARGVCYLCKISYPATVMAGSGSTVLSNLRLPLPDEILSYRTFQTVTLLEYLLLVTKECNIIHFLSSYSNWNAKIPGVHTFLTVSNILWHFILIANFWMLSIINFTDWKIEVK